ncbi:MULTISPECIES: DNA repair protein RecO [unclassified Oceanispirochaeta]|uniref:DNA repair protein RecO n=1 Tax=unclassified Oceanispirochaeta TaxID=2635722 RepID=UPI000E0989E1|nr:MULTISPECIES: DNA repair protein RecO [unclassified Oceanispirochaeta]MBF9014898.1 DNA repair protein RecO [Oceanispirochaeta sp. M2]NPD71421.1 DNA repair protein RecO [Oceanispirochaeta sp. M1]RDG33382.1 DNA repair protein RecO [Oceanispirochaeta sp. M1]
MNRHIKENYIPLKASDLGESHKLVLVLTPEQGLIRAAVFGAKGKKGGPKRILIQPFSLCRGDFYYDPVKKLWRLDEGESLESRDSFHLYLNRYYAALFWADLIIQSHAGGGSRDFFLMSRDYFKSLDDAEDTQIPRIFLKALWGYLEFEGIRPDLSTCSRCGRKAPARKAVCYSSEGQTVCSDCRMNTLPVLSARGRSMLESGFESGEELDPHTAEELSSYLLSVLKSLFRIKMDKNSLKIILK